MLYGTKEKRKPMVNHDTNWVKFNEKCKWIISLLIIFILFHSCQSPYKYISKRNSIECEFVGYKPLPTKSYPKYERFRDETKIEKLKSFISSDNIALKAYSYWALIEKLDEGYLEIMELALKDTSTIWQRCGCTYRSTQIVHSA